jgi:hypothetical protein
MPAPDLTPEQKKKINDAYVAQLKRDAEAYAKRGGLSLWQRFKRLFKR